MAQVAKVQLTDNSKELVKALESATLAALHAVGLQAVKHMVEKCPYDTGLLRNSLTYALDGSGAEKGTYKADKGTESGSYEGTVPAEGTNKRSVTIGTNVEYAPYQEYGTSKTPAQPFIRPAATEHTEEYKAIIKQFLENGA